LDDLPGDDRRNGHERLLDQPWRQKPHVTLYAAILQEIYTKGKDARFKKTERGKFAQTGSA
jgi:hypothetical protein